VNEKKIMERWKKYFSELFNEWSEYQLNQVAQVEGSFKITEEEVKAALKGMKKGKAAGLTGATIDLLQATGMVRLRELTNIMNKKIVERKYLKIGKVVLPHLSIKARAML